MTSSRPSVSLCYSSRLLKANGVVHWPTIPYTSGGRARRHRWIIFPTLMSCWCRLTADCFMSWMDRAQPRQPSAASFCRYQPAPRCCVARFMHCVSWVAGLFMRCVSCLRWSHWMLSLYVACAEISLWWPKLSQRFSETTVTRGAEARVFLNWLIRKGIGKEFKFRTIHECPAQLLWALYIYWLINDVTQTYQQPIILTFH